MRLRKIIYISLLLILLSFFKGCFLQNPIGPQTRHPYIEYPNKDNYKSIYSIGPSELDGHVVRTYVYPTWREKKVDQWDDFLTSVPDSNYNWFSCSPGHRTYLTGIHRVFSIVKMDTSAAWPTQREILDTTYFVSGAYIGYSLTDEGYHCEVELKKIP